jgi:hypothetical protein
MQLSPVQIAEHDEELPPVTSPKGDVAHYKVNHHSKKVWIKTGENDGNEQLWRLTGGSYDSVMALCGRNAQGQPVPSQEAKPIESVPVGVPGFETPDLPAESE